MQMPATHLRSVIDPVLHPVLAQLQGNNREVSDKYLKIIRLMSLFGLPAATIMFFCGKEIIHIMYGMRWDPSVPCFQILCFSMPLVLMNAPTGTIFQVCNATKHLFWVGLANSTIGIITLAVSTFMWGSVEALAYGYVLSCFIGMFVSNIDLYVGVLKLSILDLFLVLKWPLISSVFIFMILSVEGCFMHYNDVVNLFIKGATGMVVWALFAQMSGIVNINKIIKTKIFRIK